MKTAHKGFMMLHRHAQHVYQVIFKETEDGNNKITEDGNNKITENSDR
jgi:hypothetical protein